MFGVISDWRRRPAESGIDRERESFDRGRSTLIPPAVSSVSVVGGKTTSIRKERKKRAGLSTFFAISSSLLSLSFSIDIVSACNFIYITAEASKNLRARSFFLRSLKGTKDRSTSDASVKNERERERERKSLDLSVARRRRRREREKGVGSEFFSHSGSRIIAQLRNGDKKLIQITHSSSPRAFEFGPRNHHHHQRLQLRCGQDWENGSEKEVLEKKKVGRRGKKRIFFNVLTFSFQTELIEKERPGSISLSLWRS